MGPLVLERILSRAAEVTSVADAMERWNVSGSAAEIEAMLRDLRALAGYGVDQAVTALGNELRGPELSEAVKRVALGEGATPDGARRIVSRVLALRLGRVEMTTETASRTPIRGALLAFAAATAPGPARTEQVEQIGKFVNEQEHPELMKLAKLIPAVPTAMRAVDRGIAARLLRRVLEGQSPPTTPPPEPAVVLRGPGPEERGGRNGGGRTDGDDRGDRGVSTLPERPTGATADRARESRVPGARPEDQEDHGGGSDAFPGGSAAAPETGESSKKKGALTEQVEGLFKKEGSPYYYTRFKHLGTQVKRCTYKTDAEAARAEARRIREEHEREVAGLPSIEKTAATPPTEILARYVKDKRRSCKSSDHVDTIEHRVGVFLEGIDSIRKVTPDHIRSVLERLAAQPITNRATKDKKPRFPVGQTLNGYLLLLGGFFRWLKREKLWLENPTDAVDPYPEHDPVVEYRAMRPEEREKFFGAVPVDRLAAYLTTACTGLRRAEMRRLRVEDLELDPPAGEFPYVRIRKTTAKNSRPKVLPLHPDAQAALKRIVTGKEPGDAVFTELPTHETFQKDVEERAKLERKNKHGILTMTSLRKTLATDLDREGVSPAMRKKLMRHETMGLTDGTYTRYELGEMHEAVARLSVLPAARRAELAPPPKDEPEKASEQPEKPPCASAILPVAEVPFLDRAARPLTSAKGLKRLTTEAGHETSVERPHVVNQCPDAPSQRKAEVAELADALDSGSSTLTGVQVQVLSSATR